MQNAAFYSPHNEFLSTQVLNALELLKGNHFTNKPHFTSSYQKGSLTSDERGLEKTEDCENKEKSLSFPRVGDLNPSTLRSRSFSCHARLLKKVGVA